MYDNDNCYHLGIVNQLKGYLMNKWREILVALEDGSLSIEQFTTRRYRARKAGKVQLCLHMARAYELYTLNQLSNKGK